MKIFRVNNGNLQEKEYLYDALKIAINTKQMICFVGGGGKTSLIYELAKEFGIMGKRVIVTTTTHMFMPENNVVLTGNIDDIKDMLAKTNVVTVGIQSEITASSLNSSCLNRKKIKGLSLDLSSKLIDIADIVLIEADGSKRLPLKVPADHEPVILEGTTMVIGVAGLDALGKSISEICHRSNLVAEFLNVEENHIITPHDIALILNSEKGQRKSVNCEYRVVINKADNINEIDKAKKIVNELYNIGVYESIITTFRQ